MKFTATTASTLELPPGKADHLVFDDTCPGLGIRIRQGGTRTWVFQYQIGKRTPRITLGRVEALSLTKARQLWGELHARVRAGHDPATDKAERVQHAAETMGATVKTYLAQRQSVLRSSSLKSVEHCLLRNCKPLHPLPLVNVQRRTVASRLAEIVTQNGPRQSSKVRAALSAFFAWAIGEGLVENNPVTGTGRQPDKSRERVLSLPELTSIWRACDGDDDYSLIIRLLMLTGARGGEIAGLRWSELGDNRVRLPGTHSIPVITPDRILLPGTRTKNHRPHTIPITAPMGGILAMRSPRPGNDQVFGLAPNHPFVGFSVRKYWLDEQLLGQMTGPWVVHDIRRSVATHLAERDIAPHIIEAILNHVSGHKAGVAGTYNRATYEPQIRAALTMWGEHLLAAVEGKPADDGKVVQLR